MISPATIKVRAISSTAAGLSRVIISPVAVENTQTGKSIQTNGIWDTGATGSAITKDLASQLGLVPVTYTKVKGVHGIKENVNVYAVKITLHHTEVIFKLPVTECEELSNDKSLQFLIGMDVISKGDFAITNFGGKTMMTFRVPSVQHIDFVQGIKGHQPVISDKLPGRNDPCFCGSGKKFKYCHGNKGK